MTEKILLDTDIGSDIDDAICLAYLLAQPECDLLGVTTVTGEGQNRAMLASALCQLAGKDVPIYIGAENPLLIPQKQPHSPQTDVIDNWPHKTDFPRGEAVEFLRQTIRAHPGEITLLTIGPLTNIGLLFAVDPEIPQLLKGLVMMAGSFWSGDRNGQEWNVIVDPHAADIVYRTPVKLHRSIGLDVTRQVTMSADDVRARFQTGLLRPVLDFAEVWFKERDRITFHDPLAVTTIFDDQICGYGSGQVSIELDDQELLGKTHWTTDSDTAPHTVGTTVDAERFFVHYFGVLG